MTRNMGPGEHTHSSRAEGGESLSPGKITSKSLPVWRVYSDGSETVAVDETETEISRDTDPGVVFQAVSDQAHSDYSGAALYEYTAVVDGGGLMFTLDTPFTAKEGMFLQNARFDGTNLGAGSVAVTLGGPDDGFLNNAIGARNVRVIDAAGDGIKFRDTAFGVFEDIYVENSGDEALLYESCVACTFQDVMGRNAGGQAHRLTTNGDTATDMAHNLFVKCRGQMSGIGWNIVSAGVRDNTFLKCVGEDSTAEGANDSGADNIWRDCDFEDNGGRGLFSDGAGTVVETPSIGANNGGGGDTQGIRFDGTTDGVIRGPISGNDDVTIAGTCSDCELWTVPDSQIFADNGTRTLREGVGANDGDPSSTGDWNGNGSEGVIVVDTTNNVQYIYRGQTWV